MRIEKRCQGDPGNEEKPFPSLPLCLAARAGIDGKNIREARPRPQMRTISFYGIVLQVERRTFHPCAAVQCVSKSVTRKTLATRRKNASRKAGCCRMEFKVKSRQIQVIPEPRFPAVSGMTCMLSRCAQIYSSKTTLRFLSTRASFLMQVC